MLRVVKLTSKGKMTIPVLVREKLDLKPGDEVAIIEEDGRFYFENPEKARHSGKKDTE